MPDEKTTDDDGHAPGLVLVAPAGAGAADLAALRAAFGGRTTGHGIDAVLIGAGMSEAETMDLAGDQVALVQDHGAAAIVVGHSRAAGRAGADGLHVETGLADIRAAAQSFKPDRILGAGNLTTRHAAMEAGGEGVDYVLFGRLRGDTHPAPHPKAVELARWWVELIEVPAILHAGNSIQGLENLPPGVDFIALDRAVWNDPDGPAAAIGKARAILTGVAEQVA